MPYPSEHSCRLEDPDKYDKFRRQNCGEKHGDKCIDVIYGIKDGKSEVQALRYKTDIWDEDDARAHCKERDGTFEPASNEEDDRAADKEKYQCECIECGYKFESEKHCRDVKCPECGGDCRRVERPGPGQRSTIVQEADAMNGDRELRMFEMDSLEVRAGNEGETKKLRGHGAVYNKLSEDLGGFKEMFLPSSLAETIKRDDIRSLRDHTPSYILGRSKAGTLTLEEDERGIYFEVDIPDTSYARDLMVSVERRDVTGCSIIFSVEGPKNERWFVDSKEVDALDAFMAMWDGKKHRVERHIVKARLYDIGPVTFPAYPQTEIKARSLMAVIGIDYNALSAALIKARRGEALDEKEIKLLAGAGDKLRSYIPAEAEAELDGGQAPDVPELARRLERLKLRLRYGYPR